jgi:hypothetical protein
MVSNRDIAIEVAEMEMLSIECRELYVASEMNAIAIEEQLWLMETGAL